MSKLQRRGFSLGDIPQHIIHDFDLTLWEQGRPILLKAQCLQDLVSQKLNLLQTEKLVTGIFDEQDCDSILAQMPYVERLEPKFQSLGSVYNEGDQQEIEMVTFDVMEGEEIIAEDLWMKASWLSFYDDDASLRFRFSFGIDLEEDVALDPYRQKLSAELTDAVFPESEIITDNPELEKTLKKILGFNEIDFVERIIYFNAPNGGAYMHHDLERGHAGVVFAQLTGSTFWLALPKHKLIDEIIAFSKDNAWPDSLTKEMKNEMDEMCNNSTKLSEALDSFKNDTLIHLINETQAFVQFLIQRGYGYQLEAGDIFLLPQDTQENCCWHSVFCLGQEMGQALSFAVREKV